MELLHDDPIPRRFQLIRHEDESGISGTGIVASGIEWPDHVVALHWNTDINSTTIYQNLGDVVRLHGHSGKTKITFLD